MSKAGSHWKGGASWQNLPGCDVERMLSYVTDDGFVASYFHIPRSEVQAIRAAMPAVRPPPIPYLSAKSCEAVNASTKKSENDAISGSERLLRSIDKMFRRFEIDNGFVEGAGKVLLPRGWHA